MTNKHFQIHQAARELSGLPSANGRIQPIAISAPYDKRRGEPLITDVELRGIIAASNLTPTQRGTLLMMADGLYRDDLTIRIGFQRLAISLGLGRRATIDRVRSLEKTGAIRLTRGGGGRNETGRGITNIWTLDVEAIKQQALDRENADPALNTTFHDPNGAEICTDNSADNQHQGCSITTSTVQETAHDPISPIPPIEETNKEQTKQSERTVKETFRAPIRKKRKQPDGLHPWVNRFDGPKQTRANRLDQIRAQLAQSEKTAGD